MGLVLFTYLHIAADEPLARALVESRVTCGRVRDGRDGRGPCRCSRRCRRWRAAWSAQAGACFFEKPCGGRGLLLGGVPGVAPGHVVIIGGGIVGYNAAIMALGLGAQVTILERSIDRMRHLEEILSGRVTLLMSSSLEIAASVETRDLVIGAVLIPGALAPKLVTREMIGGMNAGAVVVDVAIDQGGCFETSRPTTHSDPCTWWTSDPLLRREHAGGRPDHLDDGADERHAAVRRGGRRQGHPRGGGRGSGSCAAG